MKVSPQQQRHIAGILSRLPALSYAVVQTHTNILLKYSQAARIHSSPYLRKRALLYWSLPIRAPHIQQTQIRGASAVA